MKIRVNETAVYKIIPKEQFSSVQLNDIFEECLSPANQIFAAFSTSPGQYVWNLPEADWRRLSDAGEQTQQAVKEELSQRRSSISRELAQFPRLNVDAVMSVPSDDYVYFIISPDGRIRVMLVAWDYKLPAKQDSDRVVFKTDADKKRQDVTLKIVEAGNPVPGFGLLIKLHNGKFAEKATDQDGAFKMPGMIVGQDYNIYSADHQHDFSFVVTTGVSEYVHDITKPAKVTVKVYKDGQPFADARVELDVAGEKNVLYTDNSGFAVAQFTYKQGVIVNASVEDQSSSHSLDYPDTFFEFSLHSPIVIPDPVHSIHVVDTHGNSCPGFPVNVETGGQSLSYVMDERGFAGICPIPAGTVFNISDGKGIGVRQSFTSDEADSVYDFIVPAVGIEYYELAVREEGSVEPFNYNLVFTQNGQILSPVRDAVDKFRFPKDSVLAGVPVKVDVLKSSEKFGDIDITFERSESEYELVLARENREKKGTLIKEIIVALLTAFLFFVGLLFLLILVA